MSEPQTRFGSALGAGCLILFSLPFAAVGVFMGHLAFRSLSAWQEMRSWQEVPALILEASLETSSSSDSDTFSVRARYEYTFEGQRYTGDRVAIHGGSDNIGSFHQRVAAELGRYRDSGKPFRCFVDPEAPRRSILYRELRPGLLAFYGLFVVLFGGAGFGMMGLAVWGRRRIRSDEKTRAALPDEPWKWRPEWKEGRIVSGSRKVMIGAWVFAGLWNLISSPLIFVLPKEVLERKNYPALLGILFPLVGIGLLTWAVRATLQWRRFGRSVFEMAAVPGVIGGPLRGVIRIPSRLPQPEEGFLIRLSSIRKTRTGSGKNRSTSERVLWQDQLVLDRPLTGNALSGTVLPVLFAIPYDAEESNSENTDRQTIWRLEVEAEIPGVDLDQSFEVPVFRTDASSEGFVLEEGRLAEYERPLRLEDILRRRKAVAEDLPGGGRTYHFPPQGSMAQKLILGTLTVVLGLALGLMIRMGAGWVALLVVGFFMLLMATSAYSLFTAQYRIEVERDRVTLQGGLFGLGEPRILPASDVRSWEVAGGTQQGTQMHHDLVLITTSGKRHVAVRGLRSRADAEALLEDIQGLFPS